MTECNGAGRLHTWSSAKRTHGGAYTTLFLLKQCWWTALSIALCRLATPLPYTRFYTPLYLLVACHQRYAVPLRYWTPMGSHPAAAMPAQLPRSATWDSLHAHQAPTRAFAAGNCGAPRIGSCGSHVDSGRPGTYTSTRTLTIVCSLLHATFLHAAP